MVCKRAVFCARCHRLEPSVRRKWLVAGTFHVKDVGSLGLDIIYNRSWGLSIRRQKVISEINDLSQWQ
ncbi:hypothetical protein PHYPO_G00008180 [Pangasianodon hypophthalmus]|uniref:Uncharacterized protein n=1 Tax=Pangasianodon hypophthalmus TaxID=310915 RepID=A0A5N5Q5B3_PANHP|nr:hypothetical protein PHYPO_G00008180 [Pangasianodon hypophthalmus]